jgi:hypothetical protein
LTTNLFIPVSTTPMAALLAGHGQAVWLTELGRLVTGDRVDVRMANFGHSVAVTTPVELHPELVRPEHYQQPMLRWILTAKNGPAPKSVTVLDYEAERAHNTAYYDRLKDLRKAGNDLRKLPEDERVTLEQQAPRDYWPAAAMINQMSAINAYNKAVLRWAECKPVYPELVGIIWTMASGHPGALELAMEQWESLAKRHGLEKSPLLAATQVVNPEQGKGANRAKADALTIGGQESFWLLEYFKYLGLYQGALPRTVQGRKDRKTYVLVPACDGVELDWHQRTFTAFQKEFWASSAVKMDIMAGLRYTALLLKDWEGAQRSSGRRRRASDYIDGFTVASYKDLGSAVAVMNVANIRLPDWVTWPTSAAHAQQLQQSVEEHLRIIGALDEAKSEEEQLLRDYRDFMASRDPALRAFFAFTAGYAGHVIRKLSKRQRVRRLTLDNLEVIVTANEAARQKKLAPVTANPGFRNIATAIRQATVLQQFYKTERNDNTYDVRYGLADDLLRHSRDSRDFLRALSEFLTDFNKENARVMERAKGKGYRKRIPISTEDIAQLTELIDIYDSQTIASMLIAFGYARDPRTEEPAPQNEGSTESTKSGDQDTTDDRGDADGPF